MSDEPRDDRNDNDLPRAGDLLRWAEKTQRTIEFMLRQQAEAQARSEADRERLREMQEENEARWAHADERWARADERWEHADERWKRADERWERADERWERADERWARIERMWERTEGSVRSLHAIVQIQAGEITTLAETQAEVGERVNALVNTVERLISERRNGGRGEEKTE